MGFLGSIGELMNRTLSMMVSNVGNNVQDTSSSLGALIKNWLNDSLVEVYRRTNHFSVSRFDYTFTTTAGTEDYVLPDDFDREIFVLDKTNKKQLTSITAQQWADIYSADSIDTEGTVVQYMILDDQVAAQPTSASVITVVSSSASDTGSFLVHIKGIVNGREDYETIALNGTTNAVGSKSFTRVISVSKSGDTTGTITVTSNSAAVTVANLSRTMRTHRVRKIRLIKIPSSTITIEIPYIQRLLPMSSDYDYPLLECEDAIEAGATAAAWRYKKQFSKAADFEVMFEKRVQDIIWKNESQPNRVNLFNPKPYSREV